MLKGSAIREKLREPIDFGAKPLFPSMTQPDMALSIEDILTRFVKNIPVDVNQQRGTFLDGSVDYEKLARLGAVDQAYAAKLYAAEAEAHEGELKRMIAEVNEAEAREKALKAEGKTAADAASGIESLDNTMPDDTTLRPKKLGGKGVS